MASQKNFEDLDLSQEEIKRISEALKDEKFRKMFVEYAEEISNPENRKKYEEEIAMMEQDRGMDVQFVHPQPGYVLKTVVDGDKKAFVNICTNDKIGKPTSTKQTDNTGKNGLNWQIPHSFSPPREDFDKNKQTCMVYDVVFHPDTFRMTQNPRFKRLVEDTAIEGIERQFECKLDRNNIKHPSLKYKGQPVATVIRSRKEAGSGNQSKTMHDETPTDMPYPYSDKTSAELTEENLKNIAKKEKELKNKESRTKSNRDKKEEENGFTSPKYSIIHRGYLELQDFTNARDSKPSTRPKEIVVSIELPLCRSAAGVDLDIFEEKLVLKSEKPAYKLDLKLPYPVDDENGSAKFDKAKKSLIVTLPVKPSEVPDISFTSNEMKDETADPNFPQLIEELPPLEEITTEDVVKDELPPLEDIMDDQTSDTSKCESKPLITNNSRNEVAYNMPQYEFSQDKETVTFVFHVRNITDESISKAFPKQGACLVKFMSLGSGGFPMHYGFYAEFGENTMLVPGHTTTDISEKNMTLTLLKGKESRFIWNSFLAGLNDSTLEEKLFLTTDNLNLELDQLQLEGERMGQTDLVDETVEADQATHVEVTEMNKKKLTIKISEPKVCFSQDEDMVDTGTPSSASIQIIQNKSPTELHGILKQRSVSESSEDHSCGSLGESSTSLSPRDGDCPKHVTFNSHVDKTLYKTNAAPKTIKLTLKNKRRHDRKREAKKEKSRRRRHNSNGSEYSSCEDGEDVKHSSESHSDEDYDDLSELLEQTDSKVESSGVIVEEDESTKQSDDVHVEKGETKPAKQKRKRNKNKKSKLGEEVKNKMAEMKKDEDKCDSDDDDNAEERTSQEDEVQKAQKEVSRTKNEISEHSSNDLSEVAQEKSVTAAKTGSESGEPDASGTSGAIKGDNPTICDQKNTHKMEDGYHEKAHGNEGKGDQLANLMETELSWKDVDRKSVQNEHKTECAFKFSNEVMYDLDID